MAFISTRVVDTILGMDNWMATSMTNAPERSDTITHRSLDRYTKMIVYKQLAERGWTSILAEDTARRSGAARQHRTTVGFVQTGDNVMIGELIVKEQDRRESLFVRLALSSVHLHINISNALANPRLELHNSTGALIASNDNWQTTIIGGSHQR